MPSGTTDRTSRTAPTGVARDPRQTPAMRQYTRFKEQHPDCVLFFRMGDFYELFFDDAKLAHRVLGVTLTQRTEGVPMAGVPYHAVESYLRRMIEAGYRVAVCDQVQDPSEAKGVVDRAVTRVLTPGTLVDESLLDESTPNEIAAVMFLDTGDDAGAVAALAELSTGRFTLVDLPSGRVRDELARLGPAEVLYVETADGAVPARIEHLREALNCALTARPSWTFRQHEAIELICAHFGVSQVKGFGLAEDDPALAAAGALLRYLQETQSPDQPGVDGRLGHLSPPRRVPPDQHLIIDATSLRSLEIERTMRSGQAEGSLLWVLQRCVSPMGRRLLRQWLCFPLRDRQAIEARQAAIADLVADEETRSALRESLGEVQDVARIVGRVSMGRALPRDLVALGRSIHRIDALANLMIGRPAFTTLHERLGPLVEVLMPLAEIIAARCVDHPPAHLREGGVFRDGIDAELDEARLLQRDANTWLAAYQKQLIEQTGIGSLKVGYNKVFGYYIEVTHVHTEKVPAEFTRKQTLKNAERYITGELKTFEEKVTTAEARAIEREKVLFERLCKQTAALASSLAAYADLVAELDVLACLAEVAQRYGYVRPTLVDEPVLHVTQGRHPVLDRTLGERFVPNDCALGNALIDGTTGDAQCAANTSLALITGPNMAGKSTYIRQLALIVLLAHTGSFVPAEAATIGVTDRIFTRIGANDELHAGQSTFMVEMTETANILHHATERSLVILDEIGRGTSTLDGLSLAWSIAETLAVRHCRTFFATHYHELTGLAERLDNVTNLHVSVREWGEEIIFLYRILPGRTDRSYGIHVARIAGLPRETVDRAAQLLETLAVQTEPHELPEAPAKTSSRRAQSAQLSLFTEYLPHPVVETLRELKLEQMSPLEAFDALRRLREQLEHDA